MSLSDYFYVTLPSNVKGNDKNTRGQYETILATFLNLPGEWEVALIVITYLDSLINLNKYHLVVVTIFCDNEEQQTHHKMTDAKTSGVFSG